MQKIKEKLLEQCQSLTKKEAYEIAMMMMDGKLTDSQIASILTALKIKGETPEEIAGFVNALKEKADVPEEINIDAIDTCGTGGDKKGTFNISTITAFVAAGANVKVAKHGNKAISSKSGSADILSELGVNINISNKKAIDAIKEIGIGFLFAPHFHKAMKNVANVRKELGTKTIFNIIGPLANPLNVKRQIIGVYDKKLVYKLAEVFKFFNIEHVMLVYGTCGIDEFSICSDTITIEIKNNEIIEKRYAPEDFGLTKYPLEAILGKDAKYNAKIAMDILNGEKSPYRDIVVYNSGAAIYIAGKTNSIKEGINLANESIDSGNALKKLQELIHFTNN